MVDSANYKIQAYDEESQQFEDLAHEITCETDVSESGSLQDNCKIVADLEIPAHSIRLAKLVP